MAKKDVVKDIEQVIKAAKIDIKKNGPTSDKIRQFTGLINSFTRLTTQSELDAKDDDKGDPNYYERMFSEKKQ